MQTADAGCRQSTRLVLLLFFLTGATGLSYEVIWFKQFSHVWGSSALAMVSVVGAFLLALALGGRAGDWISERTARPLRLYGACEFATAALALLIPWESGVLWRFSATYYALLRPFPFWHSLAQCALTFLILGPPGVLMGATLPLLTRHLAATTSFARAASALYGINTLGAALGCYLVGFHFLPVIGLFNTNTLTALANLGIGVVAFLIARSLGESRNLTATSKVDVLSSTLPTVVHEDTPPLVTIHCVAGLTGCAALMLQTIWNRQLALVLGSSTYAFSAMLFVVLMGIGTGSIIYGVFFSERGNRSSLLPYLTTFLAISVVTGLLLLPFTANCVGLLLTFRGHYMANAAICILASAIVEFVPAVIMGILFPFLAHLAAAATPSGNVALGRLYAHNTCGALIGVVAASLLLIPTIGTHYTALVSLLLYASAGALISRWSSRIIDVYLPVAMSTLALYTMCHFQAGPWRLNSGMFLYGYSPTQETIDAIPFFKEGVTCNVLVSRSGDTVSFRVNGKVDGNSDGDMSMQLGLAYFPRLFNPNATKVLVIGFGTGTTSGASLLFPGTNVVCCEIEPAIVSAASCFERINHSPQSSSRFTAVYDDARAYIHGTCEKYDLILSEPSNPWIAGVGNLFTTEFYEAARTRLASGGIFAQWIQTYSFTDDDYGMVLATMCDVFPQLRLIRISAGDTIILASNESLDRSASAIHESQRIVNDIPAISADLMRYFGTSSVSKLLVTRVLFDNENLRVFARAAGAQGRNRDSNLQLEFRAARHLYEARLNNVDGELLKAARPEWLIRQFRDIGQGQEIAGSVNDVALLLAGAGNVESAERIVRFGLKSSPNDVALRATSLIVAEQFNVSEWSALLEMPSDSVCHYANRVGVALWKKKRFSDAVRVFEGLRDKFPTAVTCITNLAINYREVGDDQRAVTVLREILAIDRANEYAIEELKRVEGETAFNMQ